MLLEQIGPTSKIKVSKFYFSRNHLNNKSVKYKDNIEVFENFFKIMFLRKLKINSDLKIPLEKTVGKLTLEQVLNM